MKPGDRLGPYEIVAPIGAGGMGEMYKARDTRLDRIVAIKVSREQFSERFEREARAVAQTSLECAKVNARRNFTEALLLFRSRGGKDARGVLQFPF